ncbi:MAG: insulinase family protein [Treponema sp.]|nr:insulinase family protein [Treponema sp.]
MFIKSIFNIKSSFTKLLFLAILHSPLFAFSAKDIRFMTFENGLKLYLIEDTSSALVRMELRVGAGYSAQDEGNAGYFPLYARLKNAMIDSESATRLQICAPSDAEKAMQSLSEMLEPLQLSEKKLRSEINTEQVNTSMYASDSAGFINSAIEAKVFPTAPWKRESSTDPSIFSQKSISESRAILSDISKNYYTPDNAVLYVSGNITAVAAETYAKRYFGRFTKADSRATTSEAEERIKADIKNGKIPDEKLFVLTDPKFSDEMSQVVIQYTTLNQAECDMAATAMEEEFSLFKSTLTGDKRLGIRGNEYINATSAQKSNSSRLILQTLMERTQTSPCEQVRLLLEKLDGKFFTKEAFEYEISQYTSSFVQRCDSSTQIMQILADWASLRNEKSPEKTLFARLGTLRGIDSENLSKKIAGEKPFVFVLMNSKLYSKNESALKKLGFKQITKNEGAWFRQKYYQEVMRTRNSKGNEIQEKTVEEQTEKDMYESAKRFVERNKADTKTIALTNGIRATIKTTNTNMASLSITIQGGDLMFKDKIGLTTVLADALALNIRNQLDMLHFNGNIRGMYSVTAKTEPTYSLISVKFASDEVRQALSAITGAIIFGDITPVMADGICYDERTQWRQKIATGEFQLTSYAIRKLYEKNDLALSYNDTKDKPAELKFNEIIDSYPFIIDSSRYSVVLAGNFRSETEIEKTLNETFGSLGTNKITAHKKFSIKEPSFSNMEKRIQLKHLFLTDISADKAGPMPATLIPTTKFLDPLLYIMKSPDVSSTDAALFNALLSEIATRIEKKAEVIQTTEKPTRIKIYPAEKTLPFTRIVATNVERTAMIDKYINEAFAELKSDLERIRNEEENRANKNSNSEETDGNSETENANSEIPTESEKSEESGAAKNANADEKKSLSHEKHELLSRMENRWIMENLAESGTAEGAASLIEKSVRSGNANLYLDQYEAVDSATKADYIRVMEKYLSETPKIRIYSADSKK